MADNQNVMRKCPRCGLPLPADAPEELCPHCLLALNFVTETETAREGAVGTRTQEGKSLLLSAPSPDELALHFPHLEILEILGRGGMGAVYKARQPKLDRFVALKILLRRGEDQRPDSAFAERFVREGRALARLNHPNIVAVYDYGEAGGYPFLLMEYVDGVTLRQLLERGKLVPEEALAIVPKICEALQFAHAQGIVHRDIKPENILLDKAGQVKITDFGIAKVIRPIRPDRSLTGAKDVMGTPHYMAPEQIEEPAKVDHRADIFSLGVVFYEMLTGELPLGKFQPPSDKAQIDVRLDEVVLRALAKEPELRYQQASHVKTAVETITTTEKAGAATLPNKSPLALIFEILFGITFTSPTAIKLIKLSALGFLSGLAFLGYVPFPGWHRFFGFSGFAGFFGLIGFAFMVELAQRFKKKPSAAAPPDFEKPEGPPGGPARSETLSPASPVRRLIRRTLSRAALVGFLQLVWLETILQGAPHWLESTTELWLITFFVCSIAAVGWSVWPLCRERCSLLLRVAVPIAIFVGVYGLDLFYSTIARPNLGLYEEDDWLSQVPSLRWGWRQRTAHALWRQPAAGPFTATVETILPLDEPSRIALVDLDTGRQSSHEKFAAGDQEALAWVQTEKFDLGVVSEKNTIRVLGLGLRAGYIPVPRLIRVEELTSQAAVNYWSLDRKPASAVLDLQVHKDMTGTYAFHTRDGGLGFLEFAGLNDNPRGVRLRYKLVQKPNASF